ncbi:hypothetical protein F0L74_08755 [Chitinophaga agrisoli]|uniref:Flavodoxin domain-containing protein n=1 Tax=Chitinophaga agrisoli TaxID=2607653 RepID=A0A5B2VV03_9BACT|nr:flavodoxin domain-containing protein [Chitinophaga agrisoli]KAA2242614.1 hypothetical protein F0L74_08755 [Chitinophaga agrisoli]
MKGIIIYKGKYGATRQYADWLSSALDFYAVEAGYEYQEQLALCSYIIIGTSVYLGKFQLRGWLRKHRQLLAGKKLFLFVVTGTPLHEKNKLLAYYQTNMPAELRDKCQYYFVPGKLTVRQLSPVDRLVLRVGAWLTQRNGNKITLEDYNGVKREYIVPLLNAVKGAQLPPHPLYRAK